MCLAMGIAMGSAPDAQIFFPGDDSERAALELSNQLS
jgi:hypothetical protein